MSGFMTKDNLKKHKAVIGIIIVISVLVLVYLLTACYFSRHFFPGTYINGKNCSMMTTAQAAEIIQKDIAEYSLTLLDREGNAAAVITSEQVDLTMDIEGQAKLLRDSQNIFLWFIRIFKSDSHEFPYELDYNSDKLKASLEETALFDKNQIVEAKDAYISEYIEGKGYEIIPETEGTRVDKQQLLETAGEALQKMQEKMDLAEAGCYVPAKIRREDKKLQEQCQQLNLLVNSRITYDWNGFEEVVDATLIREWIEITDGEVGLNKEKVSEFVAEKASEHDTYAKKGKFTTTQGVELTLRRGAYGWKVDQEAETEELVRLIQEGSITEREPIYSKTAYHKGVDDIGSSYVEIDMTNQHLYLYIEGEIVLESDFVSGDVSEGNTTPPGIFGITYKKRDAVLRGETYETPVSYWMPFNGNIGMHDAKWRRKFGGDIYLTNGSHGCINLPVKKAAKIYEYMKKGFPVVCYYY